MPTVNAPWRGSEVVEIHTASSRRSSATRPHWSKRERTTRTNDDGSIDYLGHMSGPGSGRVPCKTPTPTHLDSSDSLSSRYKVMALCCLVGHSRPRTEMPIGPDRVIYLNESWPPEVSHTRTMRSPTISLSFRLDRRVTCSCTSPLTACGRSRMAHAGAWPTWANVYATDDLIENGVFGPDVGDPDSPAPDRQHRHPPPRRVGGVVA